MHIAHAGRSTASVATASSSAGVWISDALLNEALHSFTVSRFPTSSSTGRSCITVRPQLLKRGTPAWATITKRQVSNVPGPLESRRRLARGRLNHAAASIQANPGPIFDPGVWLQDIWRRPKQPYWSWEPPDKHWIGKAALPPLPVWLSNVESPSKLSLPQENATEIPLQDDTGYLLDPNRLLEEANNNPALAKTEQQQEDFVELFKERLGKCQNHQDVVRLLDKNASNVMASSCVQIAFNHCLDIFRKQNISDGNSQYSVTLSDLVAIAQRPVQTQTTRYMSMVILRCSSKLKLTRDEAIMICTFLDRVISTGCIYGQMLLKLFTMMPRIHRAAFTAADLSGQQKALVMSVIQSFKTNPTVNQSSHIFFKNLFWAVRKFDSAELTSIVIDQLISDSSLYSSLAELTVQQINILSMTKSDFKTETVLHNPIVEGIMSLDLTRLARLNPHIVRLLIDQLHDKDSLNSLHNLNLWFQLMRHRGLISSEDVTTNREQNDTTMYLNPYNTTQLLEPEALSRNLLYCWVIPYLLQDKITNASTEEDMFEHFTRIKRTYNHVLKTLTSTERLGSSYIRIGRHKITPDLALLGLVRQHIAYDSLVEDVWEALLHIYTKANRSQTVLAVTTDAKRHLRLNLTDSMCDHLTSYISIIGRSKPNLALLISNLDRRIADIPNLVSIIIASKNSKIHPSRIRALLQYRCGLKQLHKQPRNDNLQNVERNNPINNLHDTALYFARALRLSDNCAWTNVNWIWRRLRDSNSPLDSRISRALVIAGIVRPVLNGTCWKIPRQRFNFILDVVRRTEGDEMADRIDRLTQDAEVNESQRKRRVFYTNIRLQVVERAWFGALGSTDLSLVEDTERERDARLEVTQPSTWRQRMKAREPLQSKHMVLEKSAWMNESTGSGNGELESRIAHERGLRFI